MPKYRPHFILAALVVLVYANTFLNSFHFDDITSILEKPWIRGLDKIPQFIFSFYHRPLVILSFNLNYAVSGFQVWSYHVVNILAHIGVTLLVYQLARLIGEFPGRKAGNGAGVYSRLPFLAALLFALHPLNTQSVTYIASRSSIFATLFYLSALILFFRGVQERRAAPERGGAAGAFHFAGAVGALVLGGLSKEIVVTWPAMALLFHYYFVSGLSPRRWLAEQWKWILLLAAALLAGLAFYALSGAKFLAASADQYSPGVYFLTQTFVIPCEYFWKMFFPFNLSIDIDFPPVTDWARLSSYGGLAALAAWAAFSLICRDPRIGFGMAWMLITLLPTSSFVPVLDLAVEHRTYLPLAGFSIFFAAGLCRIWMLARNRLAGGGGFARAGAVPVAVILIALLWSANTIRRNAVWKDEVTLWSDARDKAPRLIRPYNNLGEAYDKLRRYDEAIAEFEKALRLNPNYVFALNNLGNIYGKLESYGRAVEYFRKALAIQSDYAPANYNLAKTLNLAGKPEEALKYYRRAVEFNPYFEQALFNLAHVESRLGLARESIVDYRRFLEMRPDYARAWFGLGNAYSMNREYDQAIAAYRQAIQLNPGYLFPRINLAATYMQMGKMDEARAVYEKILILKPNLAGVHKNLGLIYARRKNGLLKALHHFQRSLTLDANQPQAGAIRKTIGDLQKELRKRQGGG
ncbi:MAG: tetratricopeptide repeat protein [Nitrospinales bacterium]